MASNNTILIVDDDPEILAYYWKIFSASDTSEFDILGSEPSATDTQIACHSLICHRFTDSVKFLDAFQKMTEQELRHPLCIIDMRMPVMNGFETAQRVRALDPEINIVICSAYSDVDPADIRAKLPGSVFFVRKPFVAIELYMMVHSLVDGWNDKQKLLRAA